MWNSNFPNIFAIWIKCETFEYISKDSEWLLIVTNCIFIYGNFPSVTELKILTSSLNNIKY